MMEFINAIFGGTIEITFAILFVVLFVFEIFTATKREERMNSTIEQQNKLIYELIKEVRKIEYEAFKK